jgi:hypothetical protein
VAPFLHRFSPDPGGDLQAEAMPSIVAPLLRALDHATMNLPEEGRELGD